MNRRYVITGGPCSGKTTLITELGSLGYATVGEAARFYIEQELIKGKTLEEVTKDRPTFEREVLALKVAREAAADAHDIVFFDRGIPDTRAYRRIHRMPEDAALLNALTHARYNIVFLLHPLPLVQDGVRIEDTRMQLEIQAALEHAYVELEHKVVHVPVLPLRERVDFVLKWIQ